MHDAFSPTVVSIYSTITKVTVTEARSTPVANWHRSNMIRNAAARGSHSIDLKSFKIKLLHSTTSSMPIYNWLADAERRGKGPTIGINDMAAARSSGSWLSFM